MAYEVLARKWRPGSFATMVGQEHVLRALTHALEAQRLHHAYLFTGTRGVGKTTVARILARCLNCEQGVTAQPCGVCSSCMEISEGRFVDLIEVDAASRTKVEDTRELLDNVQYAPTRGRFKVYLIDEVHMLSTSSFNALLKTLEEPPPHVKFLLATTDPKKLPVTVLSRCLQFHLKNLTPERIVGHLDHVLEEEGIDREPSALWALARAADGSMRDALSLTDQAIAHGGGRLVGDEVARMLGTIDQAALGRLLEGLAAADGAALLACCEDLAAHAADFPAVLADLLSLLHRVAVAQAVPGAARAGAGDSDGALIEAMAARIAVEDIQLYYQIGLLGIRDLPFAPDARTGFEMTLLRMLAFRPVDGDGAAAGGEAPPARTGAGPGPAATTSTPTAADAGRAEWVPGSSASIGGASARARPADAPLLMSVPVAQQSARPDATVHSLDHARMNAATPVGSRAAAALSSLVLEPAEANTDADSDVEADAKADARADAGTDADPAPRIEPGDQGDGPDGGLPDTGDGRLDGDRWHRMLPALELQGLTAELAAHCLPDPQDDRVGNLRLVLDRRAETLLADVHVGRLERALEGCLGQAVRVRIEAGEPPGETPARRAERLRDERQRRAVAAIENDANVQALLATFDAALQPESIRPRS